MTLEALERPAEGEPAGTLVLIHGRGADEHDLYPLLDALDPERRLRGLTPGGPLALPPGGRHWYRARRHPDARAGDVLAELQALAELPRRPPGAARARRLLAGSGDELRARLRARSRRSGRPRCCRSPGSCPTVDGLELDLTDLAGYPVAIAHGTLDPVIPVYYSRAARDVLTAAGADVDLPRVAARPHDRPADRPGAARLRRVGDRRARKYASGYTWRAMVHPEADAVASFHGEFNGREGAVDHAQTARRDRPHRCRLLQRRGLGTARHLPQDGEGALRRPSAEARRPPPAPAADRVSEPHRRRPSRTGPRPLRVGELTAARPRLPWGRGRAYRPKRDTFRAGFVASVTRRWARPPQPSRKRGAAESSSAPA